MPSSLGIARDSDTLTQQTATTSLMDDAKIKPEEKSLFQKSPLQALGLIFSNVAAGMQGRPLPTDQLRQDRLMEDQLSQKRSKAAMEMLNSVLGIASKAPEESKVNVMNTLATQVESQFPDVAKILRDPNMDFTRKQDLGQFFSDDPEMLRFASSGEANKDIAFKMLADADYRKSRRRELDFKERPVVAGKISQLLTEASSNIKTIKGQFPLDDKGNILLDFIEFEGLNALVMAEERDPANPQSALSAKEMGVLRRNPDIARYLGITLPDFEQEIDPAEIKLGAQIIASGKQLTAEFSRETRSALKGFNRQDAVELLESGKSGGITIGPDGSVKIGGRRDTQQEKRLSELDNKEIVVRNFVRESQRLIDISKEDPGVSTTARGLIRLGGSLAGNIDELVDTFKIDTKDLTFKKGLSGKDVEGAREQFEELFPEVAGRSAAFQSAAFNLAYLRLLARGESGRSISDRDLALNISNLGATLDDSKALQSALAEAQRQMVDSFKTEHQVVKREAFTGLDDVLDGGLPEGIPKRSKLIKEEGGKRFYRTPDGQVLVDG